ncbi:MAG: GntR family transcriptional regulator [Anaerolineaceae bacterium]|nr:GntR family transcriptional regulator [Anaerolineaceae bacterium]
MVRDYILNAISTNIYMPGMVIESENELSRQMNISRQTVRKALDELCAENVLFRIKGKGTFVAEKPKFSTFQCGVGFSSEMQKLNLIPGTVYVHLERIIADLNVETELQLPAQSWVWKIERVRSANGVPIAYEKSYFPYLLMKDLDEGVVRESIYGWLELKGILLGYADQLISAINADARIADLLKIKTGTPLVKMTITAYTKKGTPFNYGEMIYLTGKYQLMHTVYRQN